MKSLLLIVVIVLCCTPPIINQYHYGCMPEAAATVLEWIGCPVAESTLARSMGTDSITGRTDTDSIVPGIERVAPVNVWLIYDTMSMKRDLKSGPLVMLDILHNHAWATDTFAYAEGAVVIRLK